MEKSLANKVTVNSKMGKIYVVLVAVFAFLYIVSNILECKVFAGNIGAFEIYITGGIIAYPVLYLLTDIIGEIYGEKSARIPVYIGLGALVVEILTTQLMIHLPGNEWLCNDGAYQSVFGTNFRFAIASIVAFLVSQLVDVRVFHAIKNWTEKKFGDSKKFRWLYNNSATMTCQVLDTCIYTVISLGLEPEAWACLWSTLLVKWIIAWCDTPFFYGITNWLYKIKDKEYPELAA